MSEILLSSLQLKFAQCHTWVMKIIAKHTKIAQYILHSIYLRVYWNSFKRENGEKLPLNNFRIN